MKDKKKTDFSLAKTKCVSKTSSGKYYFPQSIPKERGKLRIIVCILLLSTLIIYGVWSNEDKLHCIKEFASLGLLIFSLEYIYRILSLLPEEIQHVMSRYEGSYLILFKDLFQMNITCFMTLIIMIIVVMQTEFKLNFSILSVSFGFILFKLCDFTDNPLYKSLWIENDLGLDYGAGMAYSYYHGYLKLILPRNDSNEKNLFELMEDYENRHHISFDSKKLFILLPKSLYCHPSLKNQNFPSIEDSKSLDEKTMTIAGVQDRVYKNSVYKIKTEDRKVYITAEYATPLKTFKDVVGAAGKYQYNYEKLKNDIVLQFYLNLKLVLSENGMNEFCELIFFDDKDEKGDYIDVGNVLLYRLKKLKNDKKKKLL